MGSPTAQFEEEYAKINEMLKEKKRGRDFWSKFRGVVDECPDPRFIKNGYGGPVYNTKQAEFALENLRRQVAEVRARGWRGQVEDEVMDQGE